MHMTPSKTLFYLCLSFIVGITLQSFIPLPRAFAWGFLIAGFLIVIIFLPTRKNNLPVFGFCFLFLAFGIIIFQITELAIENDPLRQLNDTPEKITLKGYVADAPDKREKYQKLKIKIDGTNSILLVTTELYSEYQYLNRLSIEGKLKTPEITEDFNYKNYLLKDGIYSIMDFPELEILPEKLNYTPFNFFYEKIIFLKEKIRESVYLNFKSSQRFLLEGVLLGDNKTMSPQLRDKLNSAGLRHITAVSGSHVTLMSSMIVSFLMLFPLRRQHAIIASLIFIWMYVVMIGLPASAVRAGIMGSILLLAKVLGRQNTSARTIVLAAAIMLFENPLILRYDVGFQLSFLASMGIIYLNPLFTYSLESIVKKYSEKFQLTQILQKTKHQELFLQKAKNLLDIFSITIVAQIFTLPVMLYYFGNISLIAPLTNLLVIPSIYWLMMFGFSSALIGIFSHFLGWVFSLPTHLFLYYFLAVTDVFYQPWAVKKIGAIPFFWIIIYYTMLTALIYLFNRKQKLNF